MSLPDEECRAFAPGRVNLIGDHTDYTGGLCLPMALTWGTTVRGRREGRSVELVSDGQAGAVSVPLDVRDPATVEPSWGRYVAGVVAELRPTVGLTGSVSSDLPIGAGLSSSAALEVAVALALGAEGGPLAVAALCQRAEQQASGVPCGILDQLASTSGIAGNALLLDCRSTSIEPVPMPDDLVVVVVHSGQERTLAASAYAQRRAECEAVEARIGSLRTADLTTLRELDDPVLRRRARHVVTENERVLAAAEALRTGDATLLGRIFDESHRSLRDDFECSTDAVEQTVARVRATPGVHGVRMTGGGWGGCVVAVAERGALREGWTVTAGGPARLC